MEITIRRDVKVEEKVNINFPYFTKTEIHNFFFINEKECIKVTDFFDGFSIEYLTKYPESWLVAEPSTKDEFISAYKDVNRKQINLFNKIFIEPNELPKT